METDKIEAREQLPKHLTDVLIRVGLMGFLLIICVRVLMPFMGLILWALILAVTLCPVHKSLAKRLGGSQGGDPVGVGLRGGERACQPSSWVRW